MNDLLVCIFPFQSETLEVNLSLRYTLVDEIEERKIGIVHEEGIGEGEMIVKVGPLIGLEDCVKEISEIFAGLEVDDFNVGII